jgi:typhasterol/6-deoxotyphasterol 2alpha-hydroxylase
MSVRFGSSVPVVIGSSVEIAKFFLKIHDLAFIDRPRMAAGWYTGLNFSGVLWSPYGAYWRQARTEAVEGRDLQHVAALVVRARPSRRE